MNGDEKLPDRSDDKEEREDWLEKLIKQFNEDMNGDSMQSGQDLSLILQIAAKLYTNPGGKKDVLHETLRALDVRLNQLEALRKTSPEEEKREIQKYQEMLKRTWDRLSILLENIDSGILPVEFINFEVFLAWLISPEKVLSRKVQIALVLGELLASFLQKGARIDRPGVADQPSARVELAATRFVDQIDCLRRYRPGVPETPAKYAVCSLLGSQPGIFLTLDLLTATTDDQVLSVMNILKENHAEAIFFANADYIQRSQHILKTLADNGHYVGPLLQFPSWTNLNSRIIDGRLDELYASLPRVSGQSNGIELFRIYAPANQAKTIESNLARILSDPQRRRNISWKFELGKNEFAFPVIDYWKTTGNNPIVMGEVNHQIPGFLRDNFNVNLPSTVHYCNLHDSRLSWAMETVQRHGDSLHPTETQVSAGIRIPLRSTDSTKKGCE